MTDRDTTQTPAPHDPTMAPPDALSAPVRQPPQSVHSEQAILGGLLTDNSALDSVVDVIKPDDFCRLDHREIYEQIAQIIQSGKPADPVTLAEALRNKGREAQTGGIA